jgi:hypothetical protein
MTDDTKPDYSTLNAADAAARLVEIAAEYAKGQPAKALHELSPEEAGQRLAEMTKAFHDSNKPKNSAADAKVVGDVPPQEFETTSWPQTTVRNKLDLVHHLREVVGVPEAGIAAILSGEGPYTAEDVAWAKQMKAAMLTDPDVRAYILAGSAEARRDLIGVNQILSVGAKKS